MKKVHLFSILLLTILLAVACGGTPPPAQPQQTEQTETARPSAPPPAATTPTPPPPPVQTRSGDIILDGAQAYTTVSGDTLSGISMRLYGKEYYFPLVMLASNGVQDPDVLEKDSRLTIPDLQKNLDNPGARAKIKGYLGEIAAIYDKRGKPGYAADLRSLAKSL